MYPNIILYVKVYHLTKKKSMYMYKKITKMPHFLFVNFFAAVKLLTQQKNKGAWILFTKLRNTIFLLPLPHQAFADGGSLYHRE